MIKSNFRVELAPEELAPEGAATLKWGVQMFTPGRKQPFTNRTLSTPTRYVNMPNGLYTQTNHLRPDTWNAKE
jgi:hypothetical protein